MMKIVIVDDESIFRLGIRSSVAWEKMDCMVCGEASNGEEALRLIYEKHPDVVFLDIKMPVMDGISVLKEVRDKCRDIYFVILSCFNEYDYVREAMKLGAYDYLFKPVMGISDIANVLNEIRKEKYKGKDTEDNGEKRNYQEVLEILKRGVSKEFSKEEQKQLGILDGRIKSAPYLPMAFLLVKNGKIVKAGSPEIDTCKAIILQNINLDDAYFFFPDEKNELCMVVFDEKVTHISVRKWRELCIKAAGQIREYVEAEVYIGVGRVGEALTDYSRYVQEAFFARTWSFFNGEEVNLFRLEFAQECDFEKVYEKIFEEIQDALAKKDMGKVYDFLRVLKKDVLLHKYYNMDEYCRFLAVSMVTFMRKFRNGAILEYLLLEDYNLISNIYHQLSIEGANREFLRVLQVCFQKVHGVSVHSLQEKIVTEAMQYVQDNFMEKISLNDIANRFHVNKNYFCKIFKQETGTNFINYVTERRLEKATELLENTDKKVYEIAFEVGFQSYPHFCKTYKKCKNVSPTEIRRNQFVKQQDIDRASSCSPTKEVPYKV